MTPVGLSGRCQGVTSLGSRLLLGGDSERFGGGEGAKLRNLVACFSPNSGYTEGVLTVRVKAGFDQGTLSGRVVSSA